MIAFSWKRCVLVRKARAADSHLLLGIKIYGDVRGSNAISNSVSFASSVCHRRVDVYNPRSDGRHRAVYDVIVSARAVLSVYSTRSSYYESWLSNIFEILPYSASAWVNCF